jgi:hypothetical protein
MPVQAKMPPGDGEVGGYGHLFTGPKAEKGAVIADAQAETFLGKAPRPAANLAEQGQFSRPGYLPEIASILLHILRIGQMGGTWAPVPQSEDSSSGKGYRSDTLRRLND